MGIESDPINDSDKSQKQNIFLTLGNSSILPMSSLHYDLDSVVGKKNKNLFGS